MRSNLLHSLSVSSIACSMLLVAGCGAPDFSSMKPTVTKPSAAVLLVNHPVGWTKSGVSQIQQSDSALTALTLATVDTSEKNLQSATDTLLKSHPPTLIIEVFNGVIPKQAVAVAQQHVGTRFELIGTQGNAPKAPNISIVTTQLQLTAYMTGWIAGFRSQSRGKHVVGWVTNSSGKPNILLSQALLAGIYAADPTLVITPVKSVSSSVASGNTVNAPTSGSVPPPTPVPSVNVETDPLTKANAALISGAKGEVFSVVNASGPVLSQPVPPSPQALQSDLEALVQGKWESGTKTVPTNPSIWVNPKRLSSTGNAALQNLEQAGMTLQDVRSAWKAIPKTKQKQWKQLLGL